MAKDIPLCINDNTCTRYDLVGQKGDNHENEQATAQAHIHGGEAKLEFVQSQNFNRTDDRYRRLGFIGYDTEPSERLGRSTQEHHTKAMGRIKQGSRDSARLLRDSMNSIQQTENRTITEHRKRRRREPPFFNKKSSRTNNLSQSQMSQMQKVTRLIIVSCCMLQAIFLFVDSIPKTSAFVHHSHDPNIVSTRTSKSSRITPSRITTFPSTRTTTTLFGIKGFRAWFQDQFPNAVRNVNVDEHEDRFDHVLIDMNQILHVVLRRSRNTEQATKLLMVELDTLIERCNPTVSLVLAIDGSPAAAKLATQRKRRFSILKNTQFKLKHSDKLRMSKRKRAKRLRNYKSELQSLQLSPGTECMQTMEAAILYWAWQRLQMQGRPNSRLLPKVQIYISSSLVPGEGEIKLLEWINNHRDNLAKKPGQSIALVGGDADLLLEAMVIPPSWTHNVFVLRPEESPTPSKNSSNDKDNQGKKRNSNESSSKTNRSNNTNRKFKKTALMHCTSLWEMTLSLDDYCRNNIPKDYYDPEANPSDQNLLLQIRTDMVLLFMLNGNDYLPRVVAVGFRGVLKSYLALLEKWIIEQESTRNVGLVDPNTLNFRCDFCAEFFHILGRNAPSEEDRWNSVRYSARRTYQSIVNDMSAIGFLPSPVKFHFVGGSIDGQQYNIDDRDMQDGESMFEEDDDDDDDDVNDDDDDDDDLERSEDDESAVQDEPEMQVMQLTLGNENEADYHRYKVRVNATSSKEVQKAKKALSRMALKEFSLLDYANTNADGNDSGTDYEWEITRPADANVERYLAGLIWTLQTYQDGVCPSYHYNYGKCLAPSGRVIAAYFESAVEDERDIGAEALLSEFSPGGSVCAGAACLAALPIAVKNLVPEPYSLIEDEVVEDLYSQCMDPVDNFFRLKQFETLVDAEVERLAQVERIMGVGRDAEDEDDSAFNFFSGRRILLGDHFWTVMKRTRESIQHPFQPPSPPAPNFSRLRPNNRIRVSRVISSDLPIPRPSINFTMLDDSSSTAAKNPRKMRGRNNIHVDHLNFGSLITGTQSSILQMSYKVAFGSSPDMYGGTLRSKKKKRFELLRSKEIDVSINDDGNSISRKGDRESKRIPVTITNPDNQNALVILKQLCDIQLVGGFDFGESSNGKITLTVTGDEQHGNLLSGELSFSQSSDSLKRSLTSTKQYLASLALDEIMYPGKSGEDRSTSRWHDLTFQGMKDFLELHHSVRLKNDVDYNPQKQTSLVILKQLFDIGMVASYEFDEVPASPDYPEKLSLSVSMESNRSTETLLFEQYRTNESKKWIRQQLASLALDAMISDGKSMDKKSDSTSPRWYDLTFDDTKNFIKRGSRSR